MGKAERKAEKAGAARGSVIASPSWAIGFLLFAACDPGASFRIVNPCPVALDAAVFLDVDEVPARVSDAKLVNVPARGESSDSDLGRAGETVALVVSGSRQEVYEVPFADQVRIPDEACGLDG